MNIRIPKITKNFFFIVGAFFLVWMLFIDSNDLYTQYKLRDKMISLEAEKAYYLDPAAGEGRAAAGSGAQNRGRDRGCAGQGPPAGHHPSGSQAGQHHADHGGGQSSSTSGERSSGHRRSAIREPSPRSSVFTGP